MPKVHKDAAKGIRMCPECGCKSTTYDVRDEARGLVRRRKCRECGARWVTLEGPVIAWNALAEAEEKLTAAWVAVAAARNAVADVAKTDMRRSPTVAAAE